MTEDLSAVLESQTRKDASILDEKLAEYVFFPLSNILRNQQQFPIRLTEVTITCLKTLIQYGWKSKISGDLSQQLLIFLTYVIGGVPGQERKNHNPEETTLEALKALAALIAASASSIAGAKSLAEDKNLPALGHTITVVLDIVTKGETVDIQFEALQVLDAVSLGLKDPVALATFLPGVVSSLSRLLTPPPAWKLSRKVLVKAVSVLRSMLIGVLSDIKITKLLKKTAGSDEVQYETSQGQVFTASWLKASADQVKLALASILKLRSHKAEDVQAALERFCIALLDECHRSLAVCASILVESAMILSTEDENQSLLNAGLNTSLSDLTGIYPELIDIVKTTVYNWVTSLPRVMQSSDEAVKQQSIRNLLKGQRLMSTLRIDSSTLNNTMAASLRESVSALLASNGPVSNVSEIPSTELVLSSDDRVQPGMTHFRPLLMDQTTQRSTRTELLTLISKSGTFSQHATLASDMLDSLRESTGNTQVASYWLAFELAKAGLLSSEDVDEFLDFGIASDNGGDHEYVLQELYAFSVAVLDSVGDVEQFDWRMQSLALEVTAYAASRMALDFRPELIDVLYPVATHLGSDSSQLREHAIVALNSIATSCGYANVADLIIENVDYMLNSVSLRLNTFDISPASVQVLRMMIRLTGPRLVPFLDDVVASIFSALDNYHGYPLFVENLFTVLAEIAMQGAKSSQLLIEDELKPDLDHRNQQSQMVQVEEISQFLDRRSERKRRREEDEDVERISHPKKPWKRSKDEDEQIGENEEDEEHAGQQVEEKKPPKTPTYTLLTKITNLTQHFLTSPTPTLRKSLLDLLTIVCPALSPDEEAFLPVVNAIWPVMLERLYDPEPFVVISACKALTALCSSAGNFLSTRFETAWSDGLGKWIAKAKNTATRQGSRASTRRTPGLQNSIKGIGGPGPEVVIPIRSADGLQAKEPVKPLDASAIPQPGAGLGEFTQARQVWEVVQDLLAGIVSSVRIDDDIFEHILALFGGDALTENEEARRALEVVNADAVWLVLYETSRVELLSPPRNVRELRFVEL